MTLPPSDSPLHDLPVARRPTLEAGPRLLVVQHQDDCPAEWFGEYWAQVGVTCDVVLGHRGDPVPIELGPDHVGLVVLGGGKSAYGDQQCPWLAPTKTLIKRTVEDGRPFLGICLGHQLGAVALGGTVERNPSGQAAGLTPVRLTTAGRHDPLLSVIDDGTAAVMWNGDVITAPPDGAVQLATSPDGTVQAARFGPNAWGLQFHPECSPELFRAWTVGTRSAEADRADELDVGLVIEQIEADRDNLRRWALLAHRFIDLAQSVTTT